MNISIGFLKGFTFVFSKPIILPFNAHEEYTWNMEKHFESSLNRCIFKGVLKAIIDLLASLFTAPSVMHAILPRRVGWPTIWPLVPHERGRGAASLNSHSPF